MGSPRTGRVTALVRTCADHLDFQQEMTRSPPDPKQDIMSIRNESKARQGISPFYFAAAAAIIALAVIGFLVATH